MKRQYPETPLVGVGAVIIEGPRVVLVKRAHAPSVGEWSIPGGVLEVGELLREAAMREVFEETGLMVEPSEILGVFDRILREQGRVEYHYVLIDFFCKCVSGELRQGSDAKEVRWFMKEEAENLKLSPETAEVIRRGFVEATRTSLR
jgi:8-oxo-dGTP diphosphatase